MAKKTRKLATSGRKTDTQVIGGEQKIKLTAKDRKVAAEARGISVFFGRISPDASPGWNTLTVTGLPAGTRGVSAWVTEWVTGNMPHAGSAWFTTTSVQLYDNGTKCRVRFHLQWDKHLPAAVQMVFG